MLTLYKIFLKKYTDFCIDLHLKNMRKYVVLKEQVGDMAPLNQKIQIKKPDSSARLLLTHKWWGYLCTTCMFTWFNIVSHTIIYVKLLLILNIYRLWG
jgi:hypothetical protein